MLSQEQIQAMGELSQSERTELQLAPGENVEGSLWSELRNVRLRQDGQYVFWKLRGGSEELNTFFGNIVTTYPFSTRVSSTIKDYAAVHTGAGNVYLWEIGTSNTPTQIMQNFSTSQQIQFVHRGRFLYAFDYDYGKAKYYDLETGTTYDWLSYDRAYLDQFNRVLNTNIEDNEDNLFGLEEGADIIVFPNYYNEKTTVDETFFPDNVIDPADLGSRVFFYEWNGGTYITVNGNDWKTDKYFSIPEGADPISYQDSGSGDSWTITSVDAPIDGDGNISYNSFKTTVQRINGPYLTYKTQDGADRTIQFGESPELVYPYSPDLDGLLDRPASKRLGETKTYIQDNPNYNVPSIYRAYVLVDVLKDGSITQLGQPVQVEVDGDGITTDGLYKITFNQQSAGSEVNTRYLCSTRWQISKRAAFRPSQEDYPNSPYFICHTVTPDASTVEDATSDDELLRPLNELMPLVAGRQVTFGPDQLDVNTIADFQGSLMIGGYTINRPTPKDYTDPQAATDENVLVDFTQTRDVVRNTPNGDKTVGLALMFEYTDGTKSGIIETNHNLQEGFAQDTVTDTCDNTKPAVTNDVTTAPSSDGNIEVAYDGDTVTVSVLSSDSVDDVASKVATAVNNDSVIALTANHDPSGSDASQVQFVSKRIGTYDNNTDISFNDPGTTGVTWNNNPATLTGGTKPLGTRPYAILTIRSTYVGASGGDSVTADAYVDGTYYSGITIDETDTKTDIESIIRTHINNNVPGWSAEQDGFDANGNPQLKWYSDTYGTGDNGKKLWITGWSFKPSVEIYYNSPGNDPVLNNGINASGGAAPECVQATAGIIIEENNLASSTTVNVDFDIEVQKYGSTSPQTVTVSMNDTQSISTIADNVQSALQGDPQVDFEWEVTRDTVAAGERVLLTYREYGTTGNNLSVSSAESTDVVISFESPASGGQDATDDTIQGDQVDANQIQIHSLNELVDRVFILGYTVHNSTSTYYEIAQYSMDQPEAQGMVVSLPNTDTEMDALPTFSAPASSNIKTTADLYDHIVNCLPYQQVRIDGQKQIENSARIKAMTPHLYSADKTKMRYEVGIYTDQDIQTGFFVEQQSGADRIFIADFHVVSRNVVVRSRFGVDRIQNTDFFQAQDGLYAWSDNINKILDRRRYTLTDNNTLQDVVHNQSENEFWFLFDKQEVLVMDGTEQAWRKVYYNSPDITTITSGANFKDRMFISSNQHLIETDKSGHYLDSKDHAYRYIDFSQDITRDTSVNYPTTGDFKVDVGVNQTIPETITINTSIMSTYGDLIDEYNNQATDSELVLHNGDLYVFAPDNTDDTLQIDESSYSNKLFSDLNKFSSFNPSLGNTSSLGFMFLPDRWLLHGRVTSRHLSSVRQEVRLTELEVHGRDIDCDVEVDLQHERLESSSNVWSKTFSTDLSLGNLTLKMKGRTYWINRQAYRPRIRMTFENRTEGFVDTILLNRVPLPQRER